VLRRQPRLLRPLCPYYARMAGIRAREDPRLLGRPVAVSDTYPQAVGDQDRLPYFSHPLHTASNRLEQVSRQTGEKGRPAVTPSRRTAVLLDPHPLWLEAVEAVLESIDVSVVGKATAAEEALDQVERNHPDILIVETRMLNGGMSGPSLIREARQRVSSVRVIVLGASHDPTDIDAAFDAGALAYVVKTAHPEDVAATIRQTFDHSIFLARVKTTGIVPSPEVEHADEDDDAASLTRREREILALVAEGHSNRELARMLWVTEQTVKFHLSNIYRKLDVSNRTEASRWAHKHRLVGAVAAVPA
jgi:DNA-binding NarL/FixJ family response regulator